MANLPDELPSYQLRRLIINQLWPYRHDLSFHIIDPETCFPKMEVFYKAKQIGFCLLTKNKPEDIAAIADQWVPILRKEIEHYEEDHKLIPKSISLFGCPVIVDENIPTNIVQITDLIDPFLNTPDKLGIIKNIEPIQNAHNELYNHISDALHYGMSQFKTHLDGINWQDEGIRPEKKKKNNMFKKLMKKLERKRRKK